MDYRIECINCSRDFINIGLDGKEDFKSGVPINVDDIISIGYVNLIVIQRTFIIDNDKVDSVLLHCKLPCYIREE